MLEKMMAMLGVAKPIRSFEPVIDGERYKVDVRTDGYDVLWHDCPNDEVPSGFSTSGPFYIEDESAPDGFRALEPTDPEVDDVIIESIRRWRSGVMTEDFCCAACAEEAAMHAPENFDREFDVNVDGVDWHVKVWKEVWEASPVGNENFSVGTQRDLNDPDPMRRAIDEEAFTDEGIIEEIRAMTGPNRLI